LKKRLLKKKLSHHENGKDKESDRHVKKRASPSSSRSSSAAPRKRKDSSSRSRSKSNSRLNKKHNRDHSHSHRSKHRHDKRSNSSSSRSSSAPRRKRRDSSSRSRSRSKSKEKHQKKAEPEPEKNPQLFDEYMKKRLGPYVTFSQTAEGYKPDFNINRRKQNNEKKKTALTEEEKQMMVEDMKKNAVTLQHAKIEQVRRDRVEEDGKGSKNYLAEMRKDVYSKPENFADLGDRVSRNVHYLARNLEEKNTFKR